MLECLPEFYKLECVSLYRVHAVPMEIRKRSHGTGVTEGCALPYVCWEINPEAKNFFLKFLIVCVFTYIYVCVCSHIFMFALMHRSQGQF